MIRERIRFRIDSKHNILIADLLHAILILLIPFKINWLYAIVALDSTHASMLPEVTSEKELSTATSLIAVPSLGSTTVGLALAGFIATSLNIKGILS
jgi:hypothetical protein